MKGFNKPYNRNCRSIIKDAGIDLDFTFTSHTARHTFQQWLKDEGYNSEFRMAMMGQTTLKANKQYGREFGRDIIKNVKQFNKK